MLYYKLVLKLTGSKAISLMAYTILVLNPMFIYYTSEIKQYICELFYAILLVYIWVQSTKTRWNIKKSIIFLLVCLLSIFNSSTICFVLLPIGLYDGWCLATQNNWNIKKLIKDKQVLFYIFRYLCCLTFLFGYYFLFLYNHPSSEFMLDYWKDSFVNKKNLLEILNKVFGWLFSKQISSFVFIIGLLSLLKLQDKKIFILSLCIVLTSIIFSFLKLYPLNNRLVLYWFLFLPICLASLLFYIYQDGLSVQAKLLKRIFLLICLFLAIGLYFIRNHFPIYLYDRYVKNSFLIIERDFKKEDIVIFQHIWFPHIYTEKYYTSIPRENISSINDMNWKLFLEKSMKYIVSLKELNRVWILPNIKNPQEFINALEKNKQFHDLSLKVSFCKKTHDKKLICLIERKEEQAEGK